MNECILARFFPKLQQSQITKGTEAETGLGGSREVSGELRSAGSNYLLLRSPEQGLLKSVEGRVKVRPLSLCLPAVRGANLQPS